MATVRIWPGENPAKVFESMGSSSVRVVFESGIHRLERYRDREFCLSLTHCLHITLSGEPGAILRMGEYGGKSLRGLSMIGSQDIRLENLYFHGRRHEVLKADALEAPPRDRWGRCDLVNIAHCKGVSIRDCRFDEAIGDGIYVGAVNGLYAAATNIRDCKFDACGRAAIVVGNAFNTEIQECGIRVREQDRVAEDGPLSGIDLEPPARGEMFGMLEISGNAIDWDCDRLGPRPISLSGGKYDPETKVNGKTRFVDVSGNTLINRNSVPATIGARNLIDFRQNTEEKFRAENFVDGEFVFDFSRWDR